MKSPGRMDKVAGIVLAGGRSSRMGTSKALLIYNGVPLVEYMQSLLRHAGLTDTYISGDVPGYSCLHDSVLYNGPARAMYDLLQHFAGDYDRLLFVPVDMPLLQPEALRDLMARAGSVYYGDYPLPACLVTGGRGGHEGFSSVRELLAHTMASPVSFSGPAESMMNVNTREEWTGIAS